MDAQQLQHILTSGEDSKHQFKREISRLDSLSAELAAFSNNGGGRIFIGVADNGQVIGLTPDQVRQFNQQLSNAASNNIRPPIHPLTENIVTDHGVVIVVTVPNGLNKPYMDLQGRVWVKNGADKRHVTSREEMQRMFLNAGLIQADTLPIPGSTLADLEEKALNQYLQKRYSYDSASIRILVFRDRLEIISPGHLPDNITTDEIKQGKTKRRNPVLSDHAAHLLPYRGLGSGIHRALEAWQHIELQDHRNGNEFRAVVARPEQATDPVTPPVTGQVTDPVTPPVTPSVTPPVRAALQQLEKHGELSNAQLREHLKINDRRHVRRAYIDPALEADLIEMTIPDKPNSSQQRYRLTAAGQQLLQQHEKTQPS